MRILELHIANYKQLLEEIETIKRTGVPKKVDLANKKLESFKQQIEPLLCGMFISIIYSQVCAQLLLNLAEDPATELKMKKRNIATLLICLLDWDSSDILITSLLFLKKISILKENRIELVAQSLLFI